MKRVFALYVLLFVLSGISSSAHSALIDHGGGFIYDSDLNITWLQEPNNTSMTWAQASDWAATLTYDGVSGWRLPTVTGTSINTTDNVGEMARLFYTELGNSAGHYDVDNNLVSGLLNRGPFSNLSDSTWYWSGTEQYPGFSAYIFSFGAGAYFYDLESWPYYSALAVHDGNVVPEPSAVLLLGVGLAGLAVARRSK